MEDTPSTPPAAKSPEQDIPAGDPATENSTTTTDHTPDTTPTDHTPDDTMPPTGSTPTVEETPPPQSGSTPISEQQALTTARLMQMLSEAEERGYMRARRELKPTVPPGAETPRTPLWGDPRRIEMELQNVVELGNEFLSTIRPTIWD